MEEYEGPDCADEIDASVDPDAGHYDSMDEAEMAEAITQAEAERMAEYERMIRDGVINEEEIILEIAGALGIRLNERETGFSLADFVRGVVQAFSDKGADMGAVLAAFAIKPEDTIMFVLGRWKEVLKDPAFLFAQMKSGVKGYFQTFLYQNGRNAPYHVGYSFGMFLTFLPTMWAGMFAKTAIGAPLGLRAGALGAGVAYGGTVTAPSLTATVAPEFRTQERMQEEVSQALDNFFYNHPEISKKVEIKVRMCSGIVSSTLYKLSSEDKDRFFATYSKLFLMKSSLEGVANLVEGDSKLEAGIDILVGGVGVAIDPLTREEIVFLSRITIDALYELRVYGFDDQRILDMLSILGLRIDLLQQDFTDETYIEALLNDSELLNQIPGLSEYANKMDQLHFLEAVYDPETDTIDADEFRIILINKLTQTYLQDADILLEMMKEDGVDINIDTETLIEEIESYCNREFTNLNITGKMPKQEFGEAMKQFRLPGIKINEVDVAIAYEEVSKELEETLQREVDEGKNTSEIGIAMMARLNELLDVEISLYPTDVTYEGFLSGQNTSLIRLAIENGEGSLIEQIRNDQLIILENDGLNIPFDILKVKYAIQKLPKKISHEEAEDFFVGKGLLTKEEFEKYDFVPYTLQFTRSLMLALYLRHVRTKIEAIQNDLNDQIQDQIGHTFSGDNIELDIDGHDIDLALEERRISLRLEELDIETTPEEFFLVVFAYIQNGILPGSERLSYLVEYYLASGLNIEETSGFGDDDGSDIDEDLFDSEEWLEDSSGGDDDSSDKE
jgi:hypothetical protein